MCAIPFWYIIPDDHGFSCNHLVKSKPCYLYIQSKHAFMLQNESKLNHGRTSMRDNAHHFPIFCVLAKAPLIIPL